MDHLHCQRHSPSPPRTVPTGPVVRDRFDGASTRVLSTPDTLAGTCTSNSTPDRSSLGYRDAPQRPPVGSAVSDSATRRRYVTEDGNVNRIKKLSRPHFRRRPRNYLQSILAFNIY